MRVVDSFPGDAPPETADVSCYLKANVRSHNDYMNTANAFKGLDEGLKALQPVPQEIFQDDYFRQNLPPTYGSVSLPPPSTTTQAQQADNDIFGKEVEHCSQGFQELSQHLRLAACNSSKYYNLVDSSSGSLRYTVKL